MNVNGTYCVGWHWRGWNRCECPGRQLSSPERRPGRRWRSPCRPCAIQSRNCQLPTFQEKIKLVDLCLATLCCFVLAKWKPWRTGRGGQLRGQGSNGQEREGVSNDLVGVVADRKALEEAEAFKVSTSSTTNGIIKWQWNVWQLTENDGAHEEAQRHRRKRRQSLQSKTKDPVKDIITSTHKMIEFQLFNQQ